MYEEYLDRLKNEGIIRNRKEGTIQTYTANVNKFLNWADKNPEDLTLDDCRNYIWELRVNCKFSTQHCNGVIAFVHLNMSITVSNENKDVSFQAKFSSIEKTALFTKERFDSFANTYQLTNKEREIFEILITTETATQEIADMFGISRRGLQRHVASIYEKTGTQTRVGLLISFTNM